MNEEDGAVLKQRTLDRTSWARHDEAMRAVIPMTLFLLVGCASAPSRTNAADEPAVTYEKIRALVGNASCTDSSQCRSLPLGARACGGPQSYLAWSTIQTDENALRALADRYKAERQAQIRQKGEMSDCRFMIDPGAVCEKGTCRLGDALQAR